MRKRSQSPSLPCRALRFDRRRIPRGSSPQFRRQSRLIHPAPLPCLPANQAVCHQLAILFCVILISLALLPANFASAATVDAGPLATSYFFTGEEGDPPLTSIDRPTSVTVDLSDLAGLTSGNDIAITFASTDQLLALNGFRAADGDLTLLWHARFTLTAGSYSVSSDEMWSLGPLPWLDQGSETVGYEYGPVPQSFSLFVPWGTDLASVTLTMTDLYSVSGVNAQITQSSIELASATLATASVVSPTAPEISISGNDVDISYSDNTPDTADYTDFGTVVIGSGLVTRTYTINNSGDGDLSLTGSPMVELVGSRDFSVSVQPASSTIASGGGMETFTIAFEPIGSGLQTATVSIANDDTDENPFTFVIQCRGLSHEEDFDSDGLSDASEFEMAALGFDWQVSQLELVSTYYENANKAGLFTAAQVQAINVGVPLIQRDPATGHFRLTFGLQKSITLESGSFVPFPMSPTQTTINASGELEFEFSSPDNAAFYRLEAK